MLLYKPDKNALEWKALAAACDALQTNPVTLLAECGAIPSSHDYHFNAFLAQAFPRGIAFPAWGTLPALPEPPLAAVRAFSIDDATTTEIDDALSVRELPNGNCEVGIHIAAPALSIARGSPLDAIARARLSTVYMPGRKITMLPEAAIDAFTLAEGQTPPALSLYAEVTPRRGARAHPHPRRPRADRREPAPRRGRRRVRERPAVAVGSSRGPRSCACCGNSRRRAAEARGKPDFARIDYSFYVDWDAAPRRAGVDRSAAARLAARQARVGADDLRQQHAGASCSPMRASRGSTARRRTAR